MENQKLLRVVGKTFCCGIIFEKSGDEWRIKWSAPYIRKIIGKTSIADIPKLLERKNLSWEWL